MRNSLLVLALLAGCRDEFHLPPGGDAGNAAPLAQAGIGSSYRVLSTVTVDGRDSFDPDGSIVTFHWTLLSAPPGSAAVLAGAETSVAMFVPDKVGAYALRLQVSDDVGAVDSSDLTVTVVGPALAVNAGADLTIPWLSRAQLSGTMSVEAPFTATYQWILVGGPAGSAAVLTNTSTLTPSFLGDVDGTYTIALTATSDFESVTDQVTIIVASAPQALGAVQQVDYSRPLDKLVMITSSSSDLTIHDPSTGTDTLVDLTQQNPATLALDPSGLRAAVWDYVPGNQGLAIVDLQTGTVAPRFTNLDIFSGLTFGPQNRVYYDDEYGELVTLDVATTNRVVSNEFLGRPYPRIHPGGTVMYVCEEYGSGNMARIDITTSPITFQHQFVVDVKPHIQAPFYFTADGTSIVTSQGVILHASANPAIDLTLRGVLGTRPDAFAHSLTTHELALLTAEVDSMSTFAGTRLTLINDTTLTTRFTAMLPRVNGQLVRPHWIGYRADGTTLLIVATTPFGNTDVLFVVTPP